MMCHVSCVMYHVYCVRCHVSCVMCHLSPTPTAKAQGTPRANSPSMHSRLVCQDRIQNPQENMLKAKIIMIRGSLVLQF